MSYWPKPPCFLFFVFFFQFLNFFLNVGEFQNGALQSAAGWDRDLSFAIYGRDVAYPVNISIILLKHVQQSELCRIPTTSCI